jgi:hypothetical protein
MADLATRRETNPLNIIAGGASDLSPSLSADAIEQAARLGGTPSIHYDRGKEENWSGFENQAPESALLMRQDKYNFAALEDDREELGWFEGMIETLVNVRQQKVMTERLQDLGRRMKNGYEPTGIEYEQAKADYQTLHSADRQLKDKKPPFGAGYFKFINEDIAPFIDTVMNPVWGVLPGIDWKPGMWDEYGAFVGMSTAGGALIGSIVPGPGTLAGAVKGGAFGVAKGLPVAIGAEMMFNQAGFTYLSEKIAAEYQGRDFDHNRTALITNLGAAANTVIFGLGGLPIASSMLRFGKYVTGGRWLAAGGPARQLAAIPVGAAKKAIEKAAGARTGAFLSGLGHASHKALQGARQGVWIGFNSHIIGEMQQAGLDALASGRTDEEIGAAVWDKAFDAQVLKDALISAKDTAGHFSLFSLQMMPLEMGAMSALRTVGRMPRVRAMHKAAASLKSARTVLGVTKLVKSAKAAKSAPSLIRRIIEKKLPGSEVIIDFDTWSEYWRKEGIDPREKYREVAGGYEGFDAVSDVRAPLKMGMADYALEIGRTRHGDFFAFESKTTAEANTPAELAEHKAAYAGGLREASLEFRRFQKKLSEEKLTPQEQYGAFLEMATGGELGRWEVYHRKAWDLLPQEAKALSDTPAGVKVAVEARARIKTPEEAIAAAKAELAFVERLEKDGKETLGLTSDPAETMELGWTKDKLIKKLGVTEKRANEIIDSRRAMEQVSREYAADKAEAMLKRLEWHRKGEIRDISKDVLPELDFSHGHVAFSVLAKGTLPSGIKVTDHPRFKLSTQELIEMYGREFTELLPDEIHTTKKSLTVPLEEAAVELGFNDVQRMLDGIMRDGDPKLAAQAHAAQLAENRSGPLPLYRDLVEQMWADIHSEAPTRRVRKGTIYVARDSANSRRIAREADALSGRQTRKVAEDLTKKPRIRIAEYKKKAVQKIEETPVDKLSPYEHIQSMRRNARRALLAMDRGDFAAAYDARIAELQASELHAEALRAKQALSRADAKIKRTEGKASQKEMTLAGEHFVSAANKIIKALRPDSKVETRIGSVGELNAALEAIYKDSSVEIDALKLPIRDGGKDPLTVNQTLELVDALAQIRLGAAKARTVMVEGRRINKERHIAALLAEATENLGIDFTKGTVRRGLKNETTELRKTLDAVKRFVNRGRIMPYFFRQLDGDVPNGIFERTFWKRPLASATVRFLTRKKLHRKALDVFKKNLTADEIKNASSNKYAKWIESIGMRLTLEERIGFTLLAGTEHGRKAAIEGRAYNHGQLQDIVNSLEPRHVQFVRDIFDFHRDMDGHWGEAVALDQRSRGKTPKAVEGLTIETPHGPINGGYHKIKYDHHIRSSLPGIDPLTTKEASYGAGGMTNRGYLESRKGVPDGAAARLDFNVIFEHLDEVAHDLAFREVLQDMWNLAKDKRVEGMMETVSPGMGRLMQEWIEYVAQDRDIHPDRGFLNKFLGKTRRGFQVNTMSLNVASGISQISGLTTAMHEVGIKHINRSIKDLVKLVNEEGNMLALHEEWKRLAELDPRMKERFDGGYDRDAQELFSALKGKYEEPFLVPYNRGPFLANIPGFNKPWLTSLKYFVGVSQAMMDTFIYKAGFEKAITGEQAGIRAGDIEAAKDFAFDAVQRSQGSAEKLFRAAFMRNQSELGRLLTVFFTPQVAMLNQAVNTIDNVRRQARKKQLGPVEVMAAASAITAVVILPQMIYELTKGNLLKGDDENTLMHVGGWAADLVPVVRNIKDAWEYGHGVEVPITALANKGMKLARKALKDEKENARRRSRRRGRTRPKDGKPKYTDSDIRALFSIVGTLFGLPGNALGKTASYWRAFYQDRIDMEGLTPIDIVHDSFTRGARSDLMKQKTRGRR